MGDPRVQNLARILVRYSLGVQKGQAIDVRGTTACEPLIEAVYEEILKRRAFPSVRMAPDSLSASFFEHAKSAQLNQVNPVDRAVVRAIDASIRIYSQTNTRQLSGVDPKKQARVAKTTESVSRILRRKPWVLTLFPTLAYAQDAEMSLSDFEDFVYAATFADRDDPVRAWRELHRHQQALIRKLKGADEIRILGRETDLTLSVKGRTFINSDGKKNMPSGEVFTGPIETSANGTILYDFPVCHAGREVENVRLVFRDGVVVEASATKNEAFLLKMLDMDAGARKLGELGIGTNMQIQRFTRNILFDEKIGGTIHLAVGQSYPETGGKNKSALHWDMIKDLRQDGALYVNGKPFQKDGKFVR
jgi:aminopeptidase